MTKAPVVVAVDHQPGVLRLIRHELSHRGFRVVTTHKGAQAVQVAATERPDILLIDLATPDLPGTEVVRRLRERTSAPIIMLTKHGRHSSAELGFALGANDRLDKPFSADELSERVRLALQRYPGSWFGENVIRSGDVAIDLNRRTVTREHVLVPVTATEWRLLEALAAHAGSAVGVTELADAVWGERVFGALPNVRVWIARLRRKLEEAPRHPQIILTVRGLGYSLVPNGAGARTLAAVG